MSQLVQFECQSVPKMSDIHIWPKINVNELRVFMMRRGLWFSMPRDCEVKLTRHSLLLCYQQEGVLGGIRIMVS